MSLQPLPLAGKSIYCINEGQQQKAHQLAWEDENAAPKIQAELERLEQTLSRNELAALAFVLIDRLKT